MFPTPTSEWQGTRGVGYGETVIIPSWSGQGERWIYIAIGSFSGAGQFRFYANVHAKPDNAYSTQERTARTNYVPLTVPVDEKTIIRNLLLNNSRALYFATDGRHFIKKWTIHWNGQSNFTPHPTHVFTKTHTGASYCSGDVSVAFPCGTGGGDYIKWNTGAWCNCSPQPCTCVSSQLESERQGSRTGAHEMGHCIYGLENEYNPTGNCGHSIMNNKEYSCDVTDFCVWRNGGKDPEPQTASTHSQQNNNWDCLNQRLNNYITFPADWTPDAFYRTCDNEYGVINCSHGLLDNEIVFTEVPY